PAPTPLALVLALILPLGLSACSPPGGEASTPASAGAPATAAERDAETARLNAWFEQQYEELLQFSPIQLTFLGRKDRYDEIDDVSEAGTRKRLAWLEASVRTLESEFDHDRLDPEAQLSYALWKKQYE